MNYKSFNLGDWIGHISGVIEDETTLDGNEMRDLVEFLSTLKQEPCEDAISRQAVLNTLDFTDKFLDETRTVESYKTLLEECYKNLPSVTPTRKKGKWINKSQKSGCGITFVASECTCCGMKTPFDCDNFIYRYCPNCGAEMEGGVCKGCHYNDGEVHAECVVCDKAEMEGEE